jgi:hypothetical protein
VTHDIARAFNSSPFACKPPKPIPVILIIFCPAAATQPTAIGIVLLENTNELITKRGGIRIKTSDILVNDNLQYGTIYNPIVYDALGIIISCIEQLSHIATAP